MKARPQARRESVTPPPNIDPSVMADLLFPIVADIEWLGTPDGKRLAETDAPNIRELQTVGVRYQPSAWHDSLTKKERNRLSHTAKRLEAAGFLERITEPQRDRVTHIRPTSKALRWVIEAAKGSVNQPALLEGVKSCHWAAGLCLSAELLKEMSGLRERTLVG